MFEICGFTGLFDDHMLRRLSIRRVDEPQLGSIIHEVAGVTSFRDERQGWAVLDFSEEREIAPLRRLWESIEAAPGLG